MCGIRSGVAKKTTIIPVRYNTKSLTFALAILLWRDILKDVRERQNASPPTALPGKTVINFSGGVQSNDPRYEERLKPIIQEIMDLGVVIVAAAGNSAKSAGPAITIFPAAWAAIDFPVIVVSSVERDLSISDFSNYGPQTTVWAVGYPVFGASVAHKTDYETELLGTSLGM